MLKVFALALPLAAAPGPVSDSDKARLRVLGSDILGGVMVDYCRQKAPARTEAAEAAWRRWQGASRIAAIRAALGAEAVARDEAAFAAQRTVVEEKMAGQGAPDTVCAQLPAMFAQPGFDMHGLYPAAYPVAGETEAPAGPVAEPLAPATGHGLAQAQIQTIVSSFYQGYRGVQFTLFETAYLVLKDGTARHGLPSAGPRDFDLAADRAKSPQLWGQWRRQGAGYVFRFPGDRDFAAPPGAEVHGAAPAGLTLNNDFGGASGYQFIGGAGSFSFHHLVLRGDGRFTRASSGFTGGTTGFGNQTIAAGTSWNDKGRATTVTGEGAAVRGGIVDRRATPGAELQGTYRIDGYELDLVFDSGRRESHFFYVTPNHERIGLDDGTMIVRKP